MAPHTSLDERYLLLRRLAFGGMGEVWEGSDVVLDRAVAVKILRAELADDDAFRRRFRAEARTAGRVPHPGIASVYDYGETYVDGKGLAYLVMELVPGEALSAVLAREGALGTDRTLDVVAQAARALHAAHEQGVIHRDVKPANLMVTPDGRVKVTDFGIARPADHEPLTATGQVMGTAHYLAPELARGRAATPASDIYALGVVMYECLAGRRPFEGDDQIGVATAHLSEEPPPLPGTIAPEVRALVAAAMEKDPQRRIGGADAFAAAAEALRLRPQTPASGYAYGEGYATPTSPVLGAAGVAAAAGAPETFAPSPVSGWSPASYPGAPLLPDGAVPAPGTAAANGALLSGATPPGGPSLFERPATAPLPAVGGPGSGSVPRRGRSVSLPLLALVALVLLVLIGTAIAALRPDERATPPAPGSSQTPAPTTGQPGIKPSPGTTPKATPGGSITTPARPGVPTPSRSTRVSPSPTTTPSPTASATPSTTPTGSPSPSTPTDPATTPTDPSPSPTASESPPPTGNDPGGAGNAAARALGVSPARPSTVDTGGSGST